MKPEEEFFRRFPRGCPSCGGPRRFMTFSTIEKPSRAVSLIMSGPLWGLASTKGSKALFAECQACHESWVWQETTESWLDAKQVQRVKRKKAATDRKKAKSTEEEIGKVY